jgi:hypothetical protein
MCQRFAIQVEGPREHFDLALSGMVGLLGAALFL